jgi:hypothetical protein
MADGVDAAVNGMQARSLHAPLDRATPETELHELRAFHHAVLTVCQRRDRRVLIAGVEFPMYARGNFTLAAHRPIFQARTCRRARGM